MYRASFTDQGHNNSSSINNFCMATPCSTLSEDFDWFSQFLKMWLTVILNFIEWFYHNVPKIFFPYAKIPAHVREAGDKPEGKHA